MACEVLVGTQQNHRACDLPGREHDGHCVCPWHRLYWFDLPFEWIDLLSAVEIQRRGWGPGRRRAVRGGH